MKFKRMLSPLRGAVLLPAIILMAGALPAMGKQPAFKQGELIIVVQPGTQKQDVDALAATVQAAQVEYLGIPDCYRIVLPAAKRTDQDTVNSVATLKADVRVRWANPNEIVVPRQSSRIKPNDPRYVNGDEWAVDLIRLPEAWTLQKGSPNVNLADIDDGFAPDHEDMKGQYIAGSMNFDVTPPDTNLVGTDFHGAHTSSIMVAKTNNGIGMAGAIWQDVRCLALKANAEDAILKAYAYILADKKGPNTFKVGALNMSYGFLRDVTNTADPEYIAIKNLDDAGILCVGAGAEGSDPAAPQAGNVPNGYPFVLNVVAGTRDGKTSNFNRFGPDSFGYTPRVDLVAPGGAGDGTSNDVLGVNDDTNGYTFEPGTSFACPYVTGVAGLVLSVPGVTKDIAKKALLQGANKTGLSQIPDATHGFGYLDAYGALLIVSVNATITAPAGLNSQGQSSDPANILPPPIETFKPVISFHISNVPCDNVTFTLDASIPSLTKTFTLTQLIAGSLPPGMTDFSIVGSCTVANPQYDVSFRYTFPTSSPFQHTITVNGTNPTNGTTATDTRIFTVTPHVIPAGLSMISIPYFEGAGDSPTGQFRDVPQLLGTSATLYRYLLPSEIGSQPGKVAGAYAKYSATDPAANVNASFHPLNAAPETSPQQTTASGQPLDTRPVGLGFFIDTPAAISVVNFGVSIPTTPFRIPLHEGWNMIGDPYPYSIPFNSTEIETLNSVRVPAAQAVDQGLLLPHIYRLVGGDYQFRTLPDGTLEAWEGEWIYVVPKDPANLNSGTVLYLITTPTPISGTAGRAAASRSVPPVTRAAGAGSWTVQLQAHVGDQNDSNNFIGMSAAATDGNDKTKVPKPPKPTNAVSLGIVRSNSPASIYAQDLRPIGGTKQWDVVVATDKPNSMVTLDWSNARSLPHTYRLILTDNVTGQTIDLRNTSSYQFNSGANPGTRSFSLVARPTNAISGHPVFSNVVVNPSRGGGRDANIFDIGYTISGDVHVSVSILTLGGRQLAQVGTTRAVTSGDNHTTWNGRDNAGRAVPAGSYVLQLQAVTTDGQTTRVIQPLILTGR